MQRKLVDDLGWTKRYSEHWAKVKDKLAGALDLAHRNPRMALNLIADASNTGWGAILTQVDVGELGKPLNERNHQLLACLGGHTKSNC